MQDSARDSRISTACLWSRLPRHLVQAQCKVQASKFYQDYEARGRHDEVTSHAGPHKGPHWANAAGETLKNATGLWQARLPSHHQQLQSACLILLQARSWLLVDELTRSLAEGETGPPA